MNEDFITHARFDFPNEAVGVIVNGTYKPLLNRHKFPSTNFSITARDVFELNPEWILHSHPNASAEPSLRDLEIMKDYPLIKFGILSIIDGEHKEFTTWQNGEKI